MTDLSKTDEELVRETRTGSLDSFAELVRRYEPRLHRYLSRLTGSPHDAEDLAQSAFVRVYSKLDSFREGTLFAPWLYTIARRLAIDLLRRRRPSVPIDEEHPLPAVAADGTNADLWDFARRQLDERAFTMLWLLYGEDFSVRDIAIRLSMSSVAVKVGLFRARRQLARALEADEKRTLPASRPAAASSVLNLKRSSVLTEVSS